MCSLIEDIITAFFVVIGVVRYMSNAGKAMCNHYCSKFGGELFICIVCNVK